MCKSCEDCYWKDYKGKWCIYKENTPSNEICDNFSYKCSTCNFKADYLYEEKAYCEKCLLKEFDVQSYDVTYYHIEGEQLGSDDDMSEVINNLDENIEYL